MHKYITRTLLVLLATLLATQVLLAQTVQFASYRLENEPARERNFSHNPLVLDGNSLDYTFFSIFSKGRLAVVSGEPASKDAVKIPFRIYLRRSGMIIQKGASDNGRQYYDVDIATVLAQAQHGDELVIDPVYKTDWVARRILRVRSMFWLFPLPGC
ncbi:hypothetical protein [Spirosoma validum]|uniref:Uncharacterized protein n=1 Tax=Spirosoma validum TaxID=2771355 RepID=A0A927B5M0_9BACT|nr:hypothetical protein [Spirosoma validum]MBD2755880.1 hypothetical protein [Spirosoma validum]